MGGVPGTNYIASAWILVVFSGAFVALRLYVQTRLSHWFRSRSVLLRCISEGLIVFAWIHFFTQTALDTHLYRLRVFTQREQNLARQDFLTSQQTIAKQHETILKINYAEIVIYRNPMYAIKCHMLLFYWTYLIPKSASFYKTYRFLQFSTLFVILVWPLTILLLALWCQPVSRNWTLDNARLCESGANRFVFWFCSSCHIASDLMVYFLPIPILRSIRPTQTRKKVLAYISFGFGFLCFSFALAAIIAIAGIIGIIKPTVDLATLFIFTHMEQCWAIMVPCVPAFKLFIRAWQGRRGRHLRTATQPSLVEGSPPGFSDTSRTKIAAEEPKFQMGEVIKSTTSKEGYEHMSEHNGKGV